MPKIINVRDDAPRGDAINVRLYDIDDDGAYHERTYKRHAPRAFAIDGDKFSARVCNINVKRRDDAAIIQAFIIAAARGGASSLRVAPRKRSNVVAFTPRKAPSYKAPLAIAA